MLAQIEMARRIRAAVGSSVRAGLMVGRSAQAGWVVGGVSC